MRQPMDDEDLPPVVMPSCEVSFWPTSGLSRLKSDLKRFSAAQP
jgi:hypothetical protein